MGKFNIKEVGIIGFIIYLFSLPILAWKSSKIGKVIYILALGFMLIKLIAFGVDKLGTAYFNIQGVFETRRQIDPLLMNIKAVRAELEAQAGELNKFSEGLVGRYMKGASKIDAEVALKREEILLKLKEVEDAILLIKESEREVFKSKIIKLREDVKLKGHSIEEAYIREQVEGIANKFYLLNEDEKERFNDDLVEIGFNVRKTEDKVVHIYSGSYGMSTMSTVRVLSSGSGVYGNYNMTDGLDHGGEN